MKFISLSLLFFIYISSLAQSSYLDILNDNYKILFDHEIYDSALVLAQEMSDIIIKSEGDTSIQYALNLMKCANCYMQLSQKDSAISNYKSCLYLLKRHINNEPIYYNQVLIKLAMAFKANSEFKNAEKCYLMALDNCQIYNLSLSHMSVLKNNLGYLYVTMGMYEEAEINILESISLRLESHKDSIYLIHEIHSLASVIYAKEDFETADSLYETWFRLSGKVKLKYYQYAEGLIDMATCKLKLNDKLNTQHFLLLADSVFLLNPKLKNMEEYGKLLITKADLQFADNKLNIAEETYLDAICFIERKTGEDPLSYSKACMGLANIYYKKEFYQLASAYSNKGFKYLSQYLGNEHPVYADALYMQAKILSSNGNWLAADSLLHQALDIYTKISGPNTIKVGKINNTLSLNYKKLGLFVNAEQTERNALNIAMKYNDQKQICKILNNLGFLLIDVGKTDEADSCILKSIDISKNLFGNDSAKLMYSIQGLAKLRNYNSLFNEAKQYYQLWWNIAKNLDGITEYKCRGLIEISVNELLQSHINDARTYLQMADSVCNANQSISLPILKAKILLAKGDIYFQMTQYDSALLFFKKSLLLLENNRLFNNVEYGDALISISKAHNRIGKDYNLALNYALRSKECYNNILGEYHIDYAKSLHTIGFIYDNMSLLDSALLYYKNSLSIKMMSVGEYHSEYASTLNNLGNVYSEMGNHIKACSYYKKSLEIKMRVNTAKSVGAFICMSNMADEFLNSGNLMKAEEYYNIALQSIKSIFKDEYNINIANAHSQLANYYLHIGDTFTSLIHYRNSLDIWQNRIINEQQGGSAEYANLIFNISTLLPKEEIDSAINLINTAINININNFTINIKANICKADIYLNNNKLDLAESLYDITYNNLISMDSTMYIKYLITIKRRLAKIKYEKNEFVQADSLYNISLKLSDVYYGPESISTVSIMEEMIDNYYAMGKCNELTDFLERIIVNKIKCIADNFEWMSKDQRIKYWKSINILFDKTAFFTAGCKNKSSNINGLNYDVALIQKGKLLTEDLSSDKLFGRMELIRENLADRRKFLAKLLSDGTGERTFIALLQKEVDSLDKTLSGLWPAYSEQRKSMIYSYRDVQKALDYNELAIEFIRYFDLNSNKFKYDALLLKSGQKLPQAIELCNEDELIKIDAKKGFTDYYDLIWSRLEPYMDGINEIYYSPVGYLFNVPFGALYQANDVSTSLSIRKEPSRGVIFEEHDNEDNSNPNGKIEYLMDKYRFHRLISTRQLALGLKNDSEIPIIKSISIVGGIDFNHLPLQISLYENLKQTRKSLSKSKMPKGFLPYLPGTLIEAAAINDTLVNRKWTCELFSGSDATEENIVRLEGSHAKGVLHLATHGFSFAEPDITDSINSTTKNAFSYRTSTEPMVRSGILLTGGNWTWTGSDTLAKSGAEQNGILTALEVSQLKLQKTRLVVLSACETAKGNIDPSEGTLGLVRGFKLAGVEQVIASLWDVPDNQTMELMTLFYGNLATTLNATNALEAAQRVMREKYPLQPASWAGFILTR